MIRLPLSDIAILSVSLTMFAPVLDDYRAKHINIAWDISHHPDMGQNIQWDIFNKAMDGKTEVTVAPGTYEVQRPIVLTSGMSLIGDSVTRPTLAKNPAYSGSILHVTGRDVTIKGFLFDGNNMSECAIILDR